MKDNVISILPTVIPNIVTIVSILSSILICIINNKHQLREAEQKFQQQAGKDKSTLIYVDKKNAFYVKQE